MFNVSSQAELVNNPDFAEIHESPNNYGAKYAQLFTVFGIIHLMLGIICISLEIYLITINLENQLQYFPYVVPGLWLGSCYVLAGLSGLLSGFKPEYITIIAGLIFSLAATLFSIIGVFMELIACVGAKQNIDQGELLDTIFPIHITLGIFTVIEIILGTVHCSLCGNAVCCVSNPHVYEKRSLYLAQTTQPTKCMYPASPTYDEVFHTNFGQSPLTEKKENAYAEIEDNHTQL